MNTEDIDRFLAALEERWGDTISVKRERLSNFELLEIRQGDTLVEVEWRADSIGISRICSTTPPFVGHDEVTDSPSVAIDYVTRVLRGQDSS